MSNEVLTREYGLKNFVTPTGRQLGVGYWPVNESLLIIQYIDGKPGALPEKLQGKYTKRSLAESDILSFLTVFWDESDKASKARKQA